MAYFTDTSRNSRPARGKNAKAAARSINGENRLERLSNSLNRSLSAEFKLFKI